MILLVLLLFLSVLGLTYQIIGSIMGRGNVISRIDPYIGKIEPKKEEKLKRNESYRQGLGFLARGIEKTGILSGYKEKTRKKLLKANIMMKPEEFLSIRIIAASLSGATMGFLLSSLLIGFIALIPGWAIPGVILRGKCAKRLKAINNQLGDTIAILSNALKAGHSFFQSVDSVIREIKGPVSEEFAKLQKEINLGVNTETALQNMVERVDSDDLELMVTAVLIQRQIGGNLAEILDSISNTIRQRIRAKGEIRAITAQGRMSGWIISLLPVGLAAVVSVISPSQIKTLISNPLGIMMIVMAVFMETIGIILVKKMVNVEV